MSANKHALGVAALLLAALTSGCAPTLHKTPVGGDSTEIAWLAGEWEGTYESEATGRSGSIVFRLRSGADTAEGDVLMVPRQAHEPNDVAGQRLPAPGIGGMPEPLTIRFVRVAGGEVSGVLDPYRDPECGCKLRTTFRGSLRGDRIEGTFRSEGEGIHHLPSSGRWQVSRKRTG